MKTTEKSWRWVWDTALDHALTVHPWASIDHNYARDRAKIIAVTLAMESDLKWRRQGLPHPEGDIGGNGLCQVELKTLDWMMTKLDGRSVLAERFARWIFRPELVTYPISWYRTATSKSIAWALRLGADRAAVAICSLRYMFVPRRMPKTVEEQFAYWFRFYNGKGVLKHMTLAEAWQLWLQKTRELEAAIPESILGEAA